MIEEDNIKGDGRWDVQSSDERRLSRVSGTAYVSLKHITGDSTKENQESFTPSQRKGKDKSQSPEETEEQIDEELVSELLSQVGKTSGRSNPGAHHFSIDGREDSIGYVSDHWKKSGACLFFGSVVFMIGVALMFLLAVTLSNIVLVALALITLLYGALRLGVSYYIYVDAKLVNFHSTQQRQRNSDDTYGWKARPLFWGAATFFLPPFIQYAPMVMYLYRRREQTGVP